MNTEVEPGLRNAGENVRDGRAAGHCRKSGPAIGAAYTCWACTVATLSRVDVQLLPAAVHLDNHLRVLPMGSVAWNECSFFNRAKYATVSNQTGYGQVIMKKLPSIRSLNQSAAKSDRQSNT